MEEEVGLVPKMRLLEVNLLEVSLLEVDLLEVNLLEVSPLEVNPVEVIRMKISPLEVIRGKISPLEVIPLEVIPLEVIPLEDSPPEVSLLGLLYRIHLCRQATTPQLIHPLLVQRTGKLGLWWISYNRLEAGRMGSAGRENFG